MSESELDEILNDVRRKANSSIPLDPPATSRPNQTSTISKQPSLDIDINFNNHEHTRPRSQKPAKKKNHKGLIIATVLVIMLVIVGIVSSCAMSKNKSDDSDVSTPVVENAINPLTGESGFNTSAVGKRPVAVVVENEYSTEAVRPQWGISDADIVFEAESEYSTRLLLFWADYTAVPDMVGPLRSARPPFIRFSQLFDSVFIHAGMSNSKGDYVGADTVFETENVDHVNLLEYSEDGTYFGRNNERQTSSEHTGYLNGTNLPQLLEENDINTSLDDSSFTTLIFNETAQALSDTQATSCKFAWSDGYCAKIASFSYNESTQKYTTTDFDSEYGESGVAFENLIFLFDETEYIVKEDYKGSGSSETYCDYKLSGGNGTVLSQGTAVDITWGVTDGKLWMKTTDGNDLSLNVGKSYIGYGSSNHGGSLELNVQ